MLAHGGDSGEQELLPMEEGTDLQPTLELGEEDSQGLL